MSPGQFQHIVEVFGVPDIIKGKQFLLQLFDIGQFIIIGGERINRTGLVDRDFGIRRDGRRRRKHAHHERKPGHGDGKDGHADNDKFERYL